MPINTDVVGMQILKSVLVGRKPHPVNYFEVALRQDQLDLLERYRGEEIKGESDGINSIRIENIGYTPLDNIISYTCHKCNITHVHPPKMEIIIKKHRLHAKQQLICSNCDEWVGDIMITNETKELIEKDHIILDETGEYITKKD